MKIAVIGAGAMGKKYIEWILKGNVSGLELACATTSNAEAAKWIEEIAGQSVCVYKTVDELFSNPNLFEAVLIAAPHKEHLPIAQIAFNHKKHVLCEKPSAITAAEAACMAKGANDANVALGLMFQNRANPVYKQLKNMLLGEEIGKLLRISLVCTKYFRTNAYHNSSLWRSSWNSEGGGVLINQGMHFLDIWQWLFGMPQSIFSHIQFGRYSNITVDDEATLIMHYPDKLSASFFITTGEFPCSDSSYNSDSIEIVGTKGKLLVSGDTIKCWKFSEDINIYRKTTSCFSSEGINSSFYEVTYKEDGNLYIEVMENFVRHIQHGEPLIASGEECIKSISICNAAYLSAWTERKIKLPFSEDEYKTLLNQKINNELNS